MLRKEKMNTTRGWQTKLTSKTKQINNIKAKHTRAREAKDIDIN